MADRLPSTAVSFRSCDVLMKRRPTSARWLNAVVLCVCVCVRALARGVKDQTMDMDSQPQGQQAAVPVFQPQVKEECAHARARAKTLTSSPASAVNPFFFGCFLLLPSHYSLSLNVNPRW